MSAQIITNRSLKFLMHDYQCQPPGIPYPSLLYLTLSMSIYKYQVLSTISLLILSILHLPITPKSLLPNSLLPLLLLITGSSLVAVIPIQSTLHLIFYYSNL